MMRKALSALAAGFVLCLIVLGCGPTTPTITVAHIPWPDSEATSYVIQTEQGTEVGTFDTTISRDGSTYVTTSYTAAEDATDEVVMTLNADDLKPISGTRTVYVPPGSPITTGTYVVSTHYDDDKLTIEADLPDDQHQGPVDIKIPADSYSNDQVWYLLRTLPFEEGYKGRYTNIVIWPNYAAPSLTVTVLGTESVEAPAGTFDCHKLQLAIADTTIYMWYGIAAPHYMVKYQKGDSLILLTEYPQ